MKRILIVLAMVFVLIGCSQQEPPKPTQYMTILELKEKYEVENSEKKEQVVYITDTGSKYHLAGCRYLSHSSHEIGIDEAILEGYEPCKICNP